VESLYKIYSPIEREVYLAGRLLSIGSGRVYPDFDWDVNYVHVPLDLTVQKGETLYWSSDLNAGYHRGVAAVVRNGVVFVVKYYDFPDLRTAPSIVRYDFPDTNIMFIPDASGSKEIMTFTSELSKHKIKWLYRTKNPSHNDSIFVTNKMLYTRRLVFGQLAKEAAEALALLRFDKYGVVPKGIGPRSGVHVTDAIRYLCYFIIFTPEFKDLRKITIERNIQLKKNSKDEWGLKPEAIQLEGGFTEIDPDMFL
jgi:hypothetical protein